MKKLLIAVVMTLLVAGCASSSNVVSKAEFDQIQPGMSYSQVSGIIGDPGDEISSGRTDAVPGVMEAIETKIYQWQNSDGSNMNAMFQNDKLINKAQAGLG